METNRETQVVRKADIDRTLASVPKQGKNLLEPLKSLAIAKGLPFKILEDHETSNDAEVHKAYDDLWECLEGEATFIYGGELLDPWVKKNKDGTVNEREILAKQITGGTEVVLRPGDWLWIPAGTPHQHMCKHTVRLMMIKIPRC